MKAAKFELRFLKKEKVAKNTYSFYFNRVKRGSSGKFDFKPGQYLKIFLDIKNPDERGTSRYFTISSSPTDRDFITITTRIIKSSFKLKLNSLKHGELIRAFGPLGYFNFDVKNKRVSVFLSGGMGITPFHSLLKYLNDKKTRANITLIASFPFRKETVFLDELKEIEKRNSNIRIIYTLTKEENLYPKYLRGRIDEKMIRKYVQDFEQADFFVVGPKIFEDSMIEQVKKMGIPQERIFSENFPGY